MLSFVIKSQVILKSCEIIFYQYYKLVFYFYLIIIIYIVSYLAKEYVNGFDQAYLKPKNT